MGGRVHPQIFQNVSIFRNREMVTFINVYFYLVFYHAFQKLLTSIIFIKFYLPWLIETKQKFYLVFLN
jgi:hypothetical protein